MKEIYVPVGKGNIDAAKTCKPRMSGGFEETERVNAGALPEGTGDKRTKDNRYNTIHESPGYVLPVSP